MSLKNYQAYSMAEALAAVKRDLGADAVILRTRSWKRGGFLGVGRRTVFEITATTAAEARADTVARRTDKSRGTAAAPGGAAGESTEVTGATEFPALGRRSSTGATPSRQAILAYKKADGPTDPASERQKTRQLAQAILAQHQQKSAKAAPAELSADELNKVLRAATAQRRRDRSRAVPERDVALAIGASDQAKAERLTPARETAAANVSAAGIGLEPDEATKSIEDSAVAVAEPPARVAKRLGPVPRPSASAKQSTSRSGDDAPIEEELAAIRSMVGEIMRRQVTTSARRGSASGIAAIPPQLFDWYVKLIGQDVSEELADRIVDSLRSALSEEELNDPVRVRAAVRERVASYIPTSTEPVATCSSDGRPLTIALVGPTGVGKTTTVAKLAATFKLQYGRKVGLITADTYRIAAVEQLRTYANIIGIPLEVVQTPREMTQAVHALADSDVVLIDTAGRSQKDSGRIDELQRFIAAAEPHETHLVLSGTAGEKVLLQEAEAFSVVGVERVVLSKLDETVSFGVLVDVLHRVGKSLSFLTTGQEVPDHIEPGSAERLADLVLGGAL